MIVDFHTHIFPPSIVQDRERYLADPTFRELYGDSKAKLATAEDLLPSMDLAGVAISVVLGFAWTDAETCRMHNDYLLEVAARSNGRLVAFCSVQPAGQPDAARQEVERCARAGARGLGELRPANQGWDLEKGADAGVLAEAALEHDLVLLFHVSEPVGHSYPGKRGLSLQAFYAFREAWPGVKCVGAHWGGGLPLFALMPEVLTVVRATYFDTAATGFLYSPDVFRVGLELAGADRVVFGSDYPLISQIEARRAVQTSGLSRDAVDLVLGENARLLLGIQ